MCERVSERDKKANVKWHESEAGAARRYISLFPRRVRQKSSPPHIHIIIIHYEMHPRLSFSHRARGRNKCLYDWWGQERSREIKDALLQMPRRETESYSYIWCAYAREASLVSQNFPPLRLKTESYYNNHNKIFHTHCVSPIPISAQPTGRRRRVVCIICIFTSRLVFLALIKRFSRCCCCALFILTQLFLLAQMRRQIKFWILCVSKRGHCARDAAHPGMSNSNISALFAHRFW